MENRKLSESWETVVIPKKAIARQFVQEHSGREMAEIVLPDQLPEDAPNCGGWHFYMPGPCVEEVNGSASLKFPPSWKAIRILSPYVPGKRPNIIEYPIEEALELLRATFVQH